ncbi:hypothetical protein HK100_010565 [Physocladia obscura]|uniref:Uncharacterized protein n=1 Tax=Physocladia obscura TaxID=109957 RepID=A0AAD5SMT0_9FUNG|nr:hypothetical protein HK100_010565 [Physocladia obscura]
MSDSADQFCGEFLGSGPLTIDQNGSESTSKKIENVDISDIVTEFVRIQTVLPAIMERIGFERSQPKDRISVTYTQTPAIHQAEAVQLSMKLPSKTTLIIETIFDARLELKDSETDSAPILDHDDFLHTPRSEQISPDIVYEPAALLLSPLSRPSSNQTLDEDEADREQARAWISVDIHGMKI